MKQPGSSFLLGWVARLVYKMGRFLSKNEHYIPIIYSITTLMIIKNSRDVAKVFNRRKSSNDRQVFGPKAHSSVPLARYT